MAFNSRWLISSLSTTRIVAGNCWLSSVSKNGMGAISDEPLGERSTGAYRLNGGKGLRGNTRTLNVKLLTLNSLGRLLLCYFRLNVGDVVLSFRNLRNPAVLIHGPRARVVRCQRQAYIIVIFD